MNEPVRHLAFFRAASAEVEGSSEYRELLAGLVVLRLLDKWRSLVHDPERQARELEPVERSVAALDDGPARDALRGLLDSVSAFIQGVEDTRVVRLAAYAELLERDTRFDAAADAFATATEYAPRQHPLLPHCYRRASVCFRKLGQLDRAADLLREGLEVTAENGDQPWSFRLRLTAANLTRQKGDCAEAEREIDAVIADADASGESAVSAEAHHVRGVVAYDQKQYGRAVEHYYAAVQLEVEPSLKLRAMHDVASTLGDMGYIEAAMSIMVDLRQAARTDVEVRIGTGLNLMNLATRARDRRRYDTAQRDLADERLTGRQLAWYHILLGEASLAFDDPWAAQREFATAVVEARANAEAITEREAQRLLAAQGGPQSLESGPKSLPAMVADIQNRLRELSEPSHP